MLTVSRCVASPSVKSFLNLVSRRCPVKRNFIADVVWKQFVQHGLARRPYVKELQPGEPGSPRNRQGKAESGAPTPGHWAASAAPAAAAFRSRRGWVKRIFRTSALRSAAEVSIPRCYLEGNDAVWQPVCRLTVTWLCLQWRWRRRWTGRTTRYWPSSGRCMWTPRTPRPQRSGDAGIFWIVHSFTKWNINDDVVNFEWQYFEQPLNPALRNRSPLILNRFKNISSYI